MNDFCTGQKLEVDNQPYLVVETDFVKPGKSQPFTRVKMKHLITGRVIERTYKSSDKADLADIEEHEMRLLYRDGDGAVFMNDENFEQLQVMHGHIKKDVKQWLMDDRVYSIMIYKGEPIAIDPPTFMEMKITQTDPGARGDTASGRVLKPATLESGAKVQIPIFVEEGEVIKVDTRTGTYVSRVK